VIQADDKKTPLTSGDPNRNPDGTWRQGNVPAGRNPHIKSLAEWREMFKAAYAIKGSSRFKETLEKLHEAVLQGESWAIIEVLNRCLGKQGLIQDDGDGEEQGRKITTMAEMLLCFPDLTLPLPRGCPQPTRIIARLVKQRDNGTK